MIGTDFLRLFTLGFDYANSRVYLVPNSLTRKAMKVTRAAATTNKPAGTNGQ